MKAQILLIEDDILTRTHMRGLFENEGYGVLEAENGVKGIEVFQENEIDLVVTDIIMPEKEGIETIREIRTQWNYCCF